LISEHPLSRANQPQPTGEMSVVDQRFPKTCRLLDSQAYEQVFKKPDVRVSNKYFLVLGRWTRFEQARMGVIAAKKNIARANQRNRIKRLVREVFRVRKNSLAPIDLVVMTRKGLQDLENSECLTYIHDLIKEIEKKKPSI